MDITVCLNELLSRYQSGDDDTADQWEAAADWFKRGKLRPAWTLPDAPMSIESPTGRFKLERLAECADTIFTEYGPHGFIWSVYLKRVR